MTIRNRNKLKSVVMMRHWAGYIFCVSLSLSPCQKSCSATTQVICIGVPQTDPHQTEIIEHLFLPLMEEIAELENWQLKKSYIPSDEIIPSLKNQSCDFIVGVPASMIKKNPSIVMNQEFVLSTWAQIFSKDKKKIRSHRDLNNTWIGFIKESPYWNAIDEFALPLDLSYKKVSFKSEETLVNALLAGWIDVAVFDRLYERELLGKYPIHKTSILFSPMELYISSNLSHLRDMETIDYHLKQMKKDHQSSYENLSQHLFYLPKESWLRKHLYLIIGIGGGALAILSIFSLFLKIQVTRKTRELKDKNDVLGYEILQHRKTQEALSASHHLMKSTMDCMQDGLLLIDSETLEIILSNHYVATLFGYTEDELLNINPAILFQPDQNGQNPVEALIKNSPEITRLRQETSMRKKEGKTFPGEVALTPFFDDSQKHLYWVMTLRDITARKILQESEQRLRQAQKMEAIGTLAGGIAHDFNNLLTPIIGYTQLIESEIPSPNKTIQLYLHQILNASKRAKSLTEQILSFSRNKESVSKRVSMLGIIQETLKLLRASLPSTIQIRMRLDSKFDHVYADPTKIHQVLMNLCTNAAQAMPGGGSLSLELSDDFIAVSDWSVGADYTTGRFLRLTVRDTGTGISKDIMYRIFDPFFTTKGLGQGTGMGLSVVHGIMLEYGGAISVESKLNRGTAFHIYFPKFETSPDEEEELIQSDAKDCSESILVVDDEEMIAQLLKRALEKYGYKVMFFTSSLKALQTFKENPDRFDLLLTDYTMPGQTGMELSKDVLTIRKDLPVILCTGNDVHISKEDLDTIGIKKVLLKPMLPEELAKEIRLILDQSYHHIGHREEIFA